MTAVRSAADVLAFWRAAGPEKWFNKSDDFDSAIRDDFLATYEAAAAGRLSDWQDTPEGALALVIVLDQFPRNMFRGDARSWATDPMALEVANQALAAGFDGKVARDLRPFFYLPLMHSEDLTDQQRCVELYRKLGDDENGLKYAEIHAEIIQRFGRFPHRNPVLGRTTTAEEQMFLDDGGFSG